MIMKKFTTLLIASIVILGAKVQAQPQLWGSTEQGGKYDAGVLFTTDINGENYSVEYHFPKIMGYEFMFSTLTQASNEKIYGVSNSGGLHGDGVLFEYDPAMGEYIVLHSFHTDSGEEPLTAPIEVEPGVFYGTTNYCSNSSGVIYLYTLADSTYTVIHNFTSETGSEPYGSLVFSDGKLLGMTYEGGSSGCGVIFQYDIDQQQYTDLHHFSYTDGSYPYGGLTIASNGRVFGATLSGGEHDDGTIFEFDLDNQEILQSISLQASVTSGGIYGNLVEAPNGMFYINTSWGGDNDNGAIVEFNPDDFSLSAKVHFNSETTGQDVYGSLALSAEGLLIGACGSGGENNTGTLFCFNPELDNLEILTHFTQWYDWMYTDIDEIIRPVGTPLITANGKLYGIASDGGTNDSGTLFEFDLSENNLSLVFNFESSLTGEGPHKAPIQYDKYTLYGVTNYGGQFSQGVFYKYDMVSREFIPLHHFKYTETGCGPSSELVIAENGRIYGVTNNGGANGSGTIFEFNPADESLVKVFDLSQSTGTGCSMHMLETEPGVLHGVMTYDGDGWRGTLFKFDYNQYEFTVLHHFADATGGHPNSSFYKTQNGLLYGTTMYGGQHSNGVVYTFNPEANEYSVVYNFTQGDDVGQGPLGNLIPDGEGSFYGITHGNQGAVEDRAIYKFSTETNTYTHLQQLPWGNGWHMVNWAKASNGKMYGTTYFGTEYNDGVLFEYDPLTNELQSKHTFTGVSGEGPYYPTLLEVLTPKVFHQDLQICHGDSIYLQNDFQLESGLYTDTLITEFGNDSIVFSSLYVHQIDLSITEETHSLTAITDGEYQWLSCVDFMPISGATEQTFSPETSGSYAVEITQSGCVDTTSCYYVTPVSVETSNTFNSYDVYPNPFSSLITLSNAQGLSRVQLANIMGQVVIDKVLNQDSSHSLSTNELNRGIYILIMYKSDGSKEVKRLVKN
jgi:uncharacterized repeat protein (TIGR03803 family)